MRPSETDASKAFPTFTRRRWEAPGAVGETGDGAGAQQLQTSIAHVADLLALSLSPCLDLRVLHRGWRSAGLCSRSVGFFKTNMQKKQVCVNDWKTTVNTALSFYCCFAPEADVSELFSDSVVEKISASLPTQTGRVPLHVRSPWQV